MTENPIYDTLIIGGGPSGYTAALYTARAGLRTLVLEKLSPGGQMAQSHQIDNYPGFPQGIDGFDLAERMQQQAEKHGAVTCFATVRQADLSPNLKRVETGAGDFYGSTVIIATGAEPRKLGLPQEQALVGRGISYCATCDGMFYRGKTVAVVGGGNSAVGAALYLSRIAHKVILIHRRDTLRADRVYHQALEALPNVEIRWNTAVTALLHDRHLTGLELKNTATGEVSALSCDGVFVCIGHRSTTDYLAGQLILDPEGYILADETTQTNIAGVYAAGDVRKKSLRQIVTAVADGAAAAQEAAAYLEKRSVIP